MAVWTENEFVNFGGQKTTNSVIFLVFTFKLFN